MNYDDVNLEYAQRLDDLQQRIFRDVLDPEDEETHKIIDAHWSSRRMLEQRNAFQIGD